jgi:transposase
MGTPANLSRMPRKELEAFARAAVLRNEELERRVADAEQLAIDAERRLADLVRRVAELEARLKEPPKTSGNSSLPPSKDFKADTKPAERTGPRKGSLGRRGCHRGLSENPDKIVRVMARRCGRCQAELGEADQTFACAWDKVDIPPVKPVVTRVEIYEGRCPCCGEATKPACVPEGLEPGSPFSRNIMALALYLRVIQNISYQRLMRLFGDLFGLVISQGALDALFKRAKPSFDAEVAAILSRLRKSRLVYSDETSVRVGGKNWWNWVFGNDEIVLHVIRPSRGREVVEQVLDGHRPAIWVSDLLGSQQGHAAEWQICLAHQLRDCQYAADAGDTVFASRMKRLFLTRLRHRPQAGNPRRFDPTRLQGPARARPRRHHGAAGRTERRPPVAQALRRTSRRLVHLPRPSRRRPGQQSVRTNPAPHCNLPQSHRRIPLALGAPPLRRRPLRRRHRRPKPSRRLLRHQERPRRGPIPNRWVSSY